MATDKVRIGVIGTGGMGSGHCRRMGEIPEAELTAICDIDPNTRAEISGKYQVPGFEKHTALLDSGLVDAVMIATPHYFHPPSPSTPSLADCTCFRRSRSESAWQRWTR